MIATGQKRRQKNKYQVQSHIEFLPLIMEGKAPVLKVHRYMYEKLRNKYHELFIRREKLNSVYRHCPHGFFTKFQIDIQCSGAHAASQFQALSNWRVRTM